PAPGTRRRCSSRCRSSRRARRAPSRRRPRARTRTRPGPGCRVRRRPYTDAPSQERVDVERGLLVRVRAAQRVDDLRLALLREDGLEPELGHALLDAALAYDWVRPLAAEEGARPLRVPRAAFVVPDPARAGREE